MPSERNSWTIAWSHGTATVSALGGMVGPATFDLEAGRSVQPFAIAPWSILDTPGLAAEPGHMHALRGDFFCLPFGLDAPPPNLPERWRPASAFVTDGGLHGPPANMVWNGEVSPDGASCRLRLDLPAPHPIATLARTILGRPGAPAIIIETTVLPRHDACLPVGLHPILRMPARAGRGRLHVAFRTGWTHPAGSSDSRLLPDRPFDALDAVPGRAGTLDLSLLPPAVDCEDTLQLLDVAEVRFENLDEGYSVTLDWDRTLLPDLHLWLAAGRPRAFPWHGRFRGLGLEPVCAAFDLGAAVSADAANPLRDLGHATAFAFRAGDAVTFSLTLDVARCDDRIEPQKSVSR
jgi:hypothetical protein